MGGIGWVPAVISRILPLEKIARSNDLKGKMVRGQRFRRSQRQRCNDENTEEKKRPTQLGVFGFKTQISDHFFSLLGVAPFTNYTPDLQCLGFHP